MNSNAPTLFHKVPPKQGTYGRKPVSYIKELPFIASDYLQKLPSQGNQKLDRSQVVQISRDYQIHPLVAYSCIMAWGGRDYGNFRRSLKDDNALKLTNLVKKLQKSSNSREQDFAETQKAAASISGLGISFYTKLLFFLRAKTDRAYILDQWTAKSACLLFPEVGIKLTPLGLPDPNTAPSVYAAFCDKLEACAGSTGWGVAWKTGEDVEMTLFDAPRGPWRDCLRGYFSDSKELSRQPKREIRKAQKLAKNTSAIDQTLRHFVDRLRVAYIKSLESGLQLPEPCGHFAKPNRLHVQMQNGVLLQFIINKSNTMAQMFLRGQALYVYDVLLREVKPLKRGMIHDFGGGIIGSGPKGGKTRTVNLSSKVSGGWNSSQDNWQSICDSAVDSMAELFGFLEPYVKL